MDDNGHREYGRHKSDHYKAVHSQWMIPPHQMKDQTIKIMSIIAERDNAIYERNLALSEKKAALAERDMAIVQRDAAIAERNSAIAALEYGRENAINVNDGSLCSPGCPPSRGGTKNLIHENQNASHIPYSPQLSDSSYSHVREMPITEAYPISSVPENDVKPRRMKCTKKETKTRSLPSKKISKSVKKSRRDPEDLNKQVTIAKSRGEWRGQEFIGNGEDLQNEVSVTKHEWKDQDLGLNQVIFDETTMSPPGCSCTGTFRQCYKWGNGGWQSACCTTTISMYPLPVIPNKRHARVGGRKMSGSAFTKLLSRLAREGHDLSLPVDLKNHWAKHGTNRYITIR